MLAGSRCIALQEPAYAPRVSVTRRILSASPLRTALGIVGATATLLLSCSAPGLPAIDAGGCGSLARSERGDAGAFIALSMRVCASAEAPVYWSHSAIEVLWPDGGSVITHSSEDCSNCGVVSDRFPHVSEVVSERKTELFWGANDHSRSSTCSTPTRACQFADRVPAGTYRARFCISRSAVRDSMGKPESLGPLECVEKPVEVPFNTDAVEAVFR
jgi:hypothetical protein